MKHNTKLDNTGVTPKQIICIKDHKPSLPIRTMLGHYFGLVYFTEKPFVTLKK